MSPRKWISACCNSVSCLSMILFVFVLSLLFCGGHPARAQDYGPTDASELEALFEILSSLNSDTNWRAVLPDPCNSWQQGIYCLPDNDSGDLHVTNLEFGTLSQYIDIIPCSTQASLHPSIGKLRYLQSLQVFSCFSNQSAFIPKEIGMLGDLQILTFQDNPGLVGTLPSELGNLINLQRLSVTQSGIEGSIPTELGKLVNLNQVDLSRNRLEGSVPASFDALINLQIMNLGDNFLSGALPPLSGLRSLVKMVLSNNLLNGSIPSDVGKLISLAYLDLSFNYFTGGIPPSFANLNNLEDLFMGHNGMGTSLPDFLGSMPALSRLSLAHSNYLGVIPHEFGNMLNLRVLVLTGNSLSGAIPSELESLPHIYHLDLSSNNLTGAVPFSLQFVEKMGTNLLFLNNTGLCFPQNTKRVAVATTGLNSCIIEDPESANLDARAESPSRELAIPIHSSCPPERKFMFILPLSVAVWCVVAVNFAV